MQKRCEVSLGFMPAFFQQHIVIMYGMAYYCDPVQRYQLRG